MTSYLRCLQPFEHVLPGTSRLEFRNFGTAGILDQILLCGGLSCALWDV